MLFQLSKRSDCSSSSLLSLTIGLGLKMARLLKPATLTLAAGSLDAEAARVIPAAIGSPRLKAAGAPARVNIVDKASSAVLPRRLPPARSSLRRFAATMTRSPPRARWCNWPTSS